jgi:hypothetical protein
VPGDEIIDRLRTDKRVFATIRYLSQPRRDFVHRYGDDALADVFGVIPNQRDAVGRVDDRVILSTGIIVGGPTWLDSSVSCASSRSRTAVPWLHLNATREEREMEAAWYAPPVLELISYQDGPHGQVTVSSEYRALPSGFVGHTSHEGARAVHGDLLAALLEHLPGDVGYIDVEHDAELDPRELLLRWASLTQFHDPLVVELHEDDREALIVDEGQPRFVPVHLEAPQLARHGGILDAFDEVVARLACDESNQFPTRDDTEWVGRWQDLYYLAKWNGRSMRTIRLGRFPTPGDAVQAASAHSDRWASE